MDNCLLVYGVHHMSTLAITRISLFLAFLDRDTRSERGALRCTRRFNFEFASQMNKEQFMITAPGYLNALFVGAKSGLQPKSES